MEGRAQSAIEYLMTYGWAILVIAVVLAALFSLGVFTGGNGLPTACIGQAGYLCQLQVFSAGNLIVTIGQSTGTSWTSVGVVFLNQSAITNAGTATVYAAPNVMLVGGSALTTMSSGVQYSGNVLVPGAPTTKGSSINGQLWAKYSTSAGGPFYTEIGTITARESR